MTPPPDTMHKLAALAVLFCSCASAAACEMSAALSDRYGISFAGFARPLPPARPPVKQPGKDLVRMRIPATVPVSDGFTHSVVLDRSTMRAWIVRNGGFAGIEQWYGPVDAGKASLENCRLEPAHLPEQAQAATLGARR